MSADPVVEYAAWRVSYQSGDQAARAAFNELRFVKALLAESRANLQSQSAAYEALVAGARELGDEWMREYSLSEDAPMDSRLIAKRHAEELCRLLVREGGDHA